MERVKNILQRLQELYYGKHQKSAIDVDLMLDYTRVMYADLLEWRKTFGEEAPVTEKAEPNPEVITGEDQKKPETPAPSAPANDAAQPEPESEAASEAATTAQPVAAEAPQADPADGKTEAAAAEAAPEPQAEAEEPSAEQDEATEAAENAEDNVYQPIERDEPAPKPLPETTPAAAVVQTEPEKEPLNALQQEASGISFEPPSAPDVRNEVHDELHVEEPAVKPPVEEMPAPAPAEIPLPDPETAAGGRKAAIPQGSLFHAEKAPKDIRGSIGINDKYLFLNELFNNHKSNYEETLDQLNQFATEQQADDWIRTKVAPARKWDKEDATVDSFYALVKRHFSER